MSGDARITGRISIHPPITWGELAPHDWAVGEGHPDAHVRVEADDVNTPQGVMSVRVGTAIVSIEGDTNGYTLTEDVGRIVRQFAVAPDGTQRAFTGWLHLDWGHGQYVCRVHVVDGAAVKAEPVMMWPDGARDEDGAS